MVPMPASPTHYVVSLTADQAGRLRELLAGRGWRLATVPHALWQAADATAQVTAYPSGKLVVQGKGTAEFVQFILEPEITGVAALGYEAERAAAANPAMFEPHAGIDESGKGDYFGPLVIAAVAVQAESARRLLELGVKDSKQIKSDRRIAVLAAGVRETVGGAFAVVAVGPEAYNRLYDKLHNVNRLLAWGHARALENLLDKAPDCPRAISDQFGRVETVRRALMERGRQIKLEQFTKAESDVAVAAASILARAEFVRRLAQLGEAVGQALPKGAGEPVTRAGVELVRGRGAAALARVAKLHFKTTAQVCPELAVVRGACGAGGLRR